jgi:hypothetical protein
MRFLTFCIIPAAETTSSAEQAEWFYQFITFSSSVPFQEQLCFLSKLFRYRIGKKKFVETSDQMMRKKFEFAAQK